MNGPLGRRGSVRWYAARLGAMSPAEVAWRISASVRLRLPRRDTPPGLPLWGCDGPVSAFVRELVESDRDELVKAARRLARGDVELWGRLVRAPESPAAWLRDPLDGSDWSGGPNRAERDPKPIWELHRQQHLVPLAAGACLAGEPQWASACLGQLLDWIVAAAPGGVARSSGYETAHRLLGWAFVGPMIAELVEPDGLAVVARSYAEQAVFVSERPSRFSSANNHRLLELTGLLAAVASGVAVARWDDLWGELEFQAERQTYRDGGTREQASGYLLYVLETLWAAGLLAAACGRPLGELAPRLEAMLTWVEAIADEGEELPAFGDDAEDRALRFDYFQPRRLDALAGRVRALLDGEPSLTPRPWRSGRPAASVLLADSGYAVLRGRTDGAAARVVADVGELGLGLLAAHGHADALAVTADVDRRPLLVDLGTGSYAPAGGRAHYRSTAAHNTVGVDAHDQARQLGPHLWGRRGRTTLEAATLDEAPGYVRARHETRRPRVRHTRSVTLLPDGLLVVLDKVELGESRPVVLRWHVAAGREAAVSVDALPAPEVGRDTVPLSSRYTWREETPQLSWAADGRLVHFATVISLTNKSAPPLAVTIRHGELVVDVGADRTLRLLENWSSAGLGIQRTPL